MQDLDPILASILVQGNNPSKIKTEIEVLKSPSVLINIFEFVKSKKALSNKAATKIRFKDWKKSLDIRLQKGTQVLNISYKDSDHKLILPVLNQISETYQEYSGKKRLINLNLGIDYFLNQISLFENNSNESIRNLQEFAAKHDLSSDLAETNPSLRLESFKVEQSNRLTIIKEKLRDLEINQSI